MRQEGGGVSSDSAAVKTKPTTWESVGRTEEGMGFLKYFCSNKKQNQKNLKSGKV